MNYRVVKFVLFCGAFSLLALPAGAAPVSSCAPDFSSCNIFEDGVVTLPGLAISGDVVLREANGTTSDVFRIFNDFFDSGGGTGLGTTAQLFSFDEGDLPATLSANVQFIQEGGASNGVSETDFNGNGTIYRLFSDVPEPSTFGLLGAGLLVLAGKLRKRLSA